VLRAPATWKTEGDRDGAAIWRRITDAVEQLANPTPTGPNRLYAWSGPAFAATTG
jgi:hypothetical protein